MLAWCLKQVNYSILKVSFQAHNIIKFTKFSFRWCGVVDEVVDNRTNYQGHQCDIYSFSVKESQSFIS